MTGKKIKILVISNTPWRNDNSFGNSYTSIFKGIKNFEFANIYCNYGAPENDLVSTHFQITEKTILKNLLNKKKPTGKIIETSQDSDPLHKKQISRLNFFKKNRSQLFFWIRDIIWKIGRWKSPQLKEFILSFDPDIIFQPLYYSNYINDIVLYSKQLSNVPMVSYVSDDVYTLKQFSFSPLFWLDRFIKRRKIKKVVNLCEYLYVISEIQKKEYEISFGLPCRILTKGAYFNIPIFKEKQSFPIKMVYTGNIGGGRWKSLSMIAEALQKINEKEIKAVLFIYTATPMTSKMRKTLDISGSVYLMGFIPSDKIPKIQSDADVLVHAEPLGIKGRLGVRHSFSTKIVDYFHMSRTILAVGWRDAASIDYLVKNDAALVAFDEKSLEYQLERIVNNPDILNEYAYKAWECGKRNHQIEDIQKRLYNDLMELL